MSRLEHGVRHEWADGRTIELHAAVLFSELRTLILRLPMTYERDAITGEQRERRLFHVTLGNAPTGGWLIEQFAVLGDAADEDGASPVLLLGDRARGFQIASKRREDRVYKSQDALESDLMRLAGDCGRVRLNLLKDLA